MFMKIRLFLSITIVLTVVLFLTSCAVFNLFNVNDTVVEEGQKGFFSFLDPITLKNITINQMTPPATVLIKFEYEDMLHPVQIKLEGFKEGMTGPFLSHGSSHSPVATAVFTNTDLYGTLTFISEVKRSEYLGGGMDRYQKAVFIADTTPATLVMDCYSDFFTLSTLAQPEKSTYVWFEIKLHDDQTPIFKSQFELEMAVDNFYFIINGKSYSPTISSGDRFYLYNSGRDAVILLREEFVNPEQYFFPGENEVRAFISDNQFFDEATFNFTIENPDFLPPVITDLSADPNTVEQSYSPEYDFLALDDFVLNLDAEDKIQPYLIGLYKPSGLKRVEFGLQAPDGSWIYSEPTTGYIGDDTQEIDMTVVMNMKDDSGTPLPEGIYSLYARSEDNQGNLSSFERYAVFKFGTTPFVPLEVKAFKSNGSESNRFMYGDYAEFAITDNLNLSDVVWSIAPALTVPVAFVPKSPDNTQVYWDDIQCYGDYRVIVNGTTALGKNAYGEVPIKVLVGTSPKLSFSYEVDDLKKPYDSFSITVEDELVGLGTNLDTIITDVEVFLYASGTILEPLDINYFSDSSKPKESTNGIFTKVSYKCKIDRMMGLIDSYELKDNEEVRVFFELRNYIGNTLKPDPIIFKGR